MSKPFTTMAIATHHNRIGFCFLVDKEPMDWQLAHRASRSASKAQKKVREWLDFYAPDVVIVELFTAGTRKGIRAQELTAAIKETVLESGAQFIETERQQPFANKYEQIDSLCDEFPQMQMSKPKKPRFFDPEPAETTVFEALAMAQAVLKE